MELQSSTINKSIHKERISFGSNQNLFFTDLKNEVKKYFQDKNKSSTGNSALYFKAGFISLTYFCSYYLIIFAEISPWTALLLCAYMGVAAAGLGFNVMHDGAHGSFSDKKWLNTLTAHFINILGGDAMLWKNKHNIIHHTFTNIEGFDQDIAQMPVLRLNSYQKRYWFHKFQHIYWFPLYGLSSFLWMFFLDFQKYFSRKVGNIRIPKITLQEHITFWITKLAYTTAYFIIPAYIWGIGGAVIGFAVYHFVLGVIISTVFQLAHVVEGTNFPDCHFETNKVPDSWAVHQMKTTSNFATDNKLITWYVGGLNFQVEHHLFPKISHVHYPAINKLVRSVAQKHNVPYNEHPTFIDAVKSHIRHLKKTGEI